MSDLRTVFVSLDAGADLVLADFALDTDDGLETAVLISLFTDARALDDDTLPAGQRNRRGWWGDAYPIQAGDRIGSRLWLLRASKQLQESLDTAREYAEEALAWLVEDGAANTVEVETFIAREEVMGINIRIYRPDGAAVSTRFEMLWSAMS